MTAERVGAVRVSVKTGHHYRERVAAFPVNKVPIYINMVECVKCGWEGRMNHAPPDEWVPLVTQIPPSCDRYLVKRVTED